MAETAAPATVAVTIEERPRPIAPRTTTDLAGLGAGVALAVTGVVLAIAFTETIGGMQADLIRAAGRIPSPARRSAIGLAQVAAVVVPVVAATAAALARRWRLLASAAAGAALGAAAMAVLGRTVVHDAQPASWQAVVARESWLTGRAFPTSAYVAGAVAAVVVLVRWLGPRWYRPLWWAVVALAVVRIVSGTNLPLDLVVALGVGVAAGSLALLVAGSPDLSPQGAAVAAALRRAGVNVARLVEEDPEPGVTHAYLATTGGGDTLEVDVRSDGDRDRDAVARLYARARTRTAPQGELFVPVEQAAERAAFVGLWLDDLGLRVARPRAVARVGTGAALVAHDPLSARVLTDAATDDGLVEAWRLVALLHRARIAHGSLDTDALVVDGGGRVWLRRLQSVSLDAPDALRQMDVAALLVSTALAVGADRALRACRTGLGDDALRDALPYVQIPALPLHTRLRLRGAEKLVSGVRDDARAATGAEEVELVRLARVRGSTLLGLAGGVLALVVLLPQITNLDDAARAVAGADWPWLLPVIPCVALGYLGATATLRAATPLRPPLGLTYLTQLAAATLNRITPNGIGGLGTNVRFLQRSGYDTTAAATVMALVALVNGLAGALLITMFVLWAGQSHSSLPWPSDAVVLVAAGAALGLIGLVLAVPALRRFAGRRLMPIVRQAATAAGELASDPGRAGTMLAGALGNQAVQLPALWFVLHAFGASIGIAVMGAVLFGGKALGGAAPTPGGLGAVEAALIGGLSGAGVDPAVATPAVLVFRLLTNWAVVVPGWFALRTLRRHHAL
jgi:glycosyltransferase 2 family protein